MTPVVNIYHLKPGWEKDPNYQYIGRKGRGFDGYFGNPLGTLDGYKDWLIKKIQTDAEFRKDVRDLAGKTLVCFCKPKPCHGDLLAKAAEFLAEKETLK